MLNVFFSDENRLKVCIKKTIFVFSQQDFYLVLLVHAKHKIVKSK
jgi:hypothetical protein